MKQWTPYEHIARVAASKPRKKSTKPELNNVHLPLMKMLRKHPILGLDRKLLIHVANERECSWAQGAILKAMGVKAGVSDLLLLYPGRGHPYMAMELKAPDGTLTEAQEAFFADVKSAGGYTCWFTDPISAYNELLWYLGERER